MDIDAIRSIESECAEVSKAILDATGPLMSATVNVAYVPAYCATGIGAKACEIMAADADRLEKSAQLALWASNRLRSIARGIPIG